MKKLHVDIEVTGGISKGKFLHIPLLYLAFGSNGMSITILCICFTIAFNVIDPKHPVKTLDGEQL
jgi:hypothetical protein